MGGWFWCVSSLLVDKFYLKNASLLHSSGKVDGRSYRSFLLTRSFMVVVFAFQPSQKSTYVPNISQRSALIAMYNPVFVLGFHLCFLQPRNQQTTPTNQQIVFQVSSFRRLPNLLQLLEKLPEEKWVRKDKAPEDAFQAEKMSQVISSVYVFQWVGGCWRVWAWIRDDSWTLLNETLWDCFFVPCWWSWMLFFC